MRDMEPTLKIEALCLPEGVGMRCNLYQAGFAKKSGDEGRCLGIKLPAQLALFDTAVTPNTSYNAAYQVGALAMTFAVRIPIGNVAIGDFQNGIAGTIVIADNLAFELADVIPDGLKLVF